ncbi:hypothetical protein K8I31_14280, partial [bacterium]|nr:hypothetical protein [bacterium]
MVRSLAGGCGPLVNWAASSDAASVVPAHAMNAREPPMALVEPSAPEVGSRETGWSDASSWSALATHALSMDYYS